MVFVDIGAVKDGLLLRRRGSNFPKDPKAGDLLRGLRVASVDLDEHKFTLVAGPCEVDMSMLAPNFMREDEGGFQDVECDTFPAPLPHQQQHQHADVEAVATAAPSMLRTRSRSRSSSSMSSSSSSRSDQLPR